MSLIEGDPHRDWDEEPPSPTGHFPDVEINHTFFGYIEALFAMGAIQGSGSGLYGSDDDVTRGQAAKMLTEALAEYRTYDDGECPFLDVCPGHTFYHHIRRLKELGITTGFDDSSYRPDAPLTRAETVTLIIRSRGESPDYADCVNPFSDVLCDNAHYHNVRRLKALFDEKGISLGHGDGTFRPDEAMSRGGIAKLIVVGLDLEGYIPRFFDVLSDNKFYLYIQGIAARGITDGCGSNPPLFCHDDLLTRGQASKFVARGLGEEPTYDDSVLPFPDVNPGDTFYIYIRRLKELDVISGFRDGSFRANQNITRGEMAKLIVGALASQGVVCRYEADPEFSDVAITDTFYREIQCLKELGITSGFSDSTFRADKTITRAAAAKFIYLAFVQRTPSLAQEESDVRNNSRATAPLYAELTHNDIGVHAHGGIPPLVLPANDEDWIQLPSAAQAASLARALTYEMTIESASINTDVCMQVFNEAGEILAAQGSVGAAGARLSQNANSRLVWSPSAGDGTRFYLRLTNMNPYAKEGAFVYLNVETSTGGTPTDPGTATPSPTTVPSTPTDGTPTTTPTRQPDSTIRSLYLPLMAQDNEQNRLVYAQHIDRTEACPGPNDSGIERTPTSAPTAETPMSTPVPPTYTSTPTPVQPTATPVPPTPTFTPTPTPFEFTDDFSNASSGWNTNTASDYRTYYGSNDFRIEINGGNREVWETNSNARVNGFDYVAMVDGELNAGGPIRYGLIFDILDGRNFYVFTVNPESQSWRLELVQNGSRSTLREGTSSSIKQGGRANLIEIHRTGNTIKAVVEFNTVTTISSRAFTGDLRVGLVAKAGNDSATAEFDDFELQEIVGR
ncbi:MAG: S-layer homology domain-containing protein [Chloroflexota bacterium]